MLQRTNRRTITTKGGKEIELLTRPMTAKEYRLAYEQLDLTQEAMSALMQFSPRNSRRYANEEAPLPQLEAKIIRLLLTGKLSVKALADA